MNLLTYWWPTDSLAHWWIHWQTRLTRLTETCKFYWFGKFCEFAESMTVKCFIKTLKGKVSGFFVQRDAHQGIICNSKASTGQQASKQLAEIWIKREQGQAIGAQQSERLQPGWASAGSCKVATILRIRHGQWQSKTIRTFYFQTGSNPSFHQVLDPYLYSLHVILKIISNVKLDVESY